MPQESDPSQEIMAQEKTVVGFGLRDVAEAAQFFEAREILHALRDLRRTKVDPANHTGDAGMALGKLQEEKRFVFGLVCLHGDGGADGAGLKFRLQILGKKIAFQDRHFVGDPGITRGVVFPEVLVRIDSHGRNRW